MAQRWQHLARELIELPEHERQEVLAALDEDVALQQPIDPVAAGAHRRGNALVLFRRVADHLGLDNDGRRGMTMAQFDAASGDVRNGWRAAHVADAFRGWRLAKRALLGETLPVDVEQRHHRWRLTFGRVRYERHLSAVPAWLDTDPAERSQAAYDLWRTAENERRRQQATRRCHCHGQSAGT